MPALPDVPDVIRCDLKYIDDEDTNMLNRIFLHYSGATSTSDLNTYAATIAGAWNTNMAPVTRSEVHLIEVLLTDLSTLTSPIGVWVGDHAGTAGSGPAPGGIAMNVNFKIPRRYRGGKPKAFLPGPRAVELTDDQKWASSRIAAWSSAWTAFMGAVLGGAPGGLSTVTHVNVSYFEGHTVVTHGNNWARNVPTLRGTPIVDPVSGYVFDARPGSQRRRNLQGR